MNNLFNRIQLHLLLIVALSIAFFSVPAASHAADIDVYAEGAYTETDLVIYIYADINAGPILSFGVSIEYPADLTFSAATKNEDVWYFGEGGPDHTYMDPEHVAPVGSNPGSVTIIGGKLDTTPGAASDGVNGSRVLLGSVTFTHAGVTDFSGVTLTYGRGDGTSAYKNFVGTDGTVYDSADTSGVDFSIGIYERGDANADGSVTPADMIAIRNHYYGGAALASETAADCNGDGEIAPADMICVRNKYYN